MNGTVKRRRRLTTSRRAEPTGLQAWVRASGPLEARYPEGQSLDDSAGLAALSPPSESLSLLYLGVTGTGAIGGYSGIVEVLRSPLAFDGHGFNTIDTKWSMWYRVRVPSEPELDTDEKGNVTFWLRKSLADEVRRLKSIGLVQPNAVVERALAEAVSNAMEPTKHELVQRLRAARHERRSGPDYVLGYTRGERWARDVASWDEITQYAGLGHSDVSFEASGGRPQQVAFAGAFRAPADAELAPFFSVDDNDEFPSVTSHPRLVQYWRGWLDGVKAVHTTARDGMEVEEVAGFAEARAHFIGEATSEYQGGYAKALEVSNELKLRDLEEFADKGFALKPWLDYMQSGVHYDLIQGRDVKIDRPLEVLMDALGSFADPIGFELPTPGRSFLAGFTQALQDLWASLSDPADAAGRRAVTEADLVVGQRDPFVGAQARTYPRLTRREKEILRLLVAGKSNSQIAEHLKISPRRLQAHLEKQYKRMRDDFAVKPDPAKYASSGEEGVKPMGQ